MEWRDNGGGAVEDFSASTTVVHFERPLPVLRGPILAGSSDDPSAGPFVLAFRDAEAWKSAFRDTVSKVTHQCEVGARVGCSISASKKCSPPWWKSLFGVAAVDFAEREACEEREMSACIEASKEPCKRYGKEKCLAPFRDARIALIEPKGIPNSSYSHASNEGLESNNGKPEAVGSSTFCWLEVTNYRGSVLLENSSIEKICGE